MSVKFSYAFVAFVLAISAVGCSGSDDQATEVEPSTLVSTAVATADSADVGQRSITVGGMGADYGPPDRSVIDIGVAAQRSSVDRATADAAAAGEAMIAALTAAGVSADDIQTSQFGIHPTYDQYDYSRVVGYEVNIGYRVTIENVTSLGAVLADAVEVGGDSVRAWSIGFEGDPAGHMDVARAEAWADVRQRAEATAAEIGEPLGPLVDVHEKVLLSSPQGMVQGGEGDAAAFDVPISPGVVGVIVLLTATYGIGSTSQ